MNCKNIALVIMTIALITIGVFYAYDKYQDKLQESYIEGINVGQLNYINTQWKTRNVVYPVFNESEIIVGYKQTNFDEICGGGE